MARTSKKAKAVTVAAFEEAASVGEVGTVAAIATSPETSVVAASGATVFIPLNKLKKSPRNARKTPHSEADIEAYAGSIAVSVWPVLQAFGSDPMIAKVAAGVPTIIPSSPDGIQIYVLI
jgi:ParB family chromosome partitioning protein